MRPLPLGLEIEMELGSTLIHTLQIIRSAITSTKRNSSPPVSGLVGNSYPSTLRHALASPLKLCPTAFPTSFICSLSFLLHFIQLSWREEYLSFSLISSCLEFLRAFNLNSLSLDSWSWRRSSISSALSTRHPRRPGFRTIQLSKDD